MREQFAVAGLPTVVVAKPSGDEIDRTYGFLNTQAFIDTVEGYQKGVGTLDAMLAKEPEMAADLHYVYALGNKFYERRRWDEADQRYASIIKHDTTNADDMAAKAQLKRAIVAGRQEQYPLANAFLTALLEKWPQSEQLPEATVYMGYYAHEDGHDDEAVAAYKQYLDKWPEGEDAEWVASQIKQIESPEEGSE